MKRTPLMALAALPLLLGSLTPPLALASAAPQVPLTVVLDAAHGGRDPGVVGLDGLVREDDVVLAIARKVQGRLERQGVRVILTRADGAELSLQERVKRVPGAADMFISLHAGASRDPASQGVQTVIARQEAGTTLLAKSRQIAEHIQAAVVASTGARNGGVLVAERYFVLRKASVPAVLLEVGYLTNDREAKLLSQARYQDRIADGIARAVLAQR